MGVLNAAVDERQNMVNKQHMEKDDELNRFVSCKQLGEKSYKF